MPFPHRIRGSAALAVSGFFALGWKGAVLIVRENHGSVDLPARLAASGYTAVTVDPADGPTNAGRPAVESALLAAGLRHEEKVFMGAREGFFDTAGPQADAAYKAIVGWFDRYLV